eukprot:4844104-Pleurochrysis_carterae.AAC.1
MGSVDRPPPRLASYEYVKSCARSSSISLLIPAARLTLTSCCWCNTRHETPRSLSRQAYTSARSTSTTNQRVMKSLRAHTAEECATQFCRYSDKLGNA